MDRKLSAVQEENKKLQEELNVIIIQRKEEVRRKLVERKRSEMKSCASYINLYSKQDSKRPSMQSLITTLNSIDINNISDIESIVPKVFSDIESGLSSDDLVHLINSVCTRLIEEQTSRLILEEKTYQIISEKEFRVRELEARVKDLEMRPHSASMDKIMSPKHLLEPYEPPSKQEPMNKIVNGLLEQVYDFAIDT
jgi:hypothetical protein